MERATLNGIELEYEVAGTGEPVVFIHGALIADAFRPLVRQASLVSEYRLLNYHRRGHAGSSPLVGSISVGRQAGTVCT
jgi:pimeloyl-ACP methyl ester carboxylesterase